MNVFKLYKDMWSEFNWLGKLILFPLILLGFPLFSLICICFKEK